METVFKKGDKVFDYRFGWGVVKDIKEGAKYLIKVIFDYEEEEELYTFDGKLFFEEKFPSLSFTEYNLVYGGFSQTRIVDFSIWEKDKWFKITYTENKDVDFYKGDVNLKEVGNSILVEESYGIRTLYNQCCFGNVRKIKSFDLATKEEVEELYSKFPELKPKPKLRGVIIEGCETDPEFSLKHFNKKELSTVCKENVTAPTIEELEALTALKELLFLRDEANEGTLCDWSNQVLNFWGISFVDDEIKLTIQSDLGVLVFKDDKIAKKFKENNKELIEKAKYFL